MQTHNTMLKILGLTACISALGIGTESRAWAKPTDVLVVVNKSNAVKSLSIDEVRSIYLGNKKFWSGQNKITPVGRKYADPPSAQFFDKVIKMSSGRYRLYWQKRSLAGKGVEPKKASDAKVLITSVAANQSAIGFVTRSEFDSSGGASVQVVFTLSAD